MHSIVSALWIQVSKVGVVYSPGQREEQKLLKWFWEIIKEWPHEKRASFLQFFTGTSQVPVGGFKELQGAAGKNHAPAIKFMRYNARGPERQKYTVSHTCFNRIDMPCYTSKKEMETYLEASVKLMDLDVGIGLE